MLRLVGFEVEHIDETDAALQRLSEWKGAPPAIFVVDMMMPYGKSFTAEDTDGGLATGSFLIRECRRLFSGVPVVCFSNREKSEEMRMLIGDTPHLAKYETSTIEFAKAIQNILTNQ